VANWQWSIFWPKSLFLPQSSKSGIGNYFFPVLAAFFGAAAQLKPNNMEEISARK